MKFLMWDNVFGKVVAYGEVESTGEGYAFEIRKAIGKNLLPISQTRYLNKHLYKKSAH